VKFFVLACAFLLSNQTLAQRPEGAEVYRPLGAVLPPEVAGSLPSGDPAAVAFELRRQQDGEVWNVDLHLGDGRHFALGFEPVERRPAYGGLESDSVTVRRLGGADGPIHIHWLEEGGGAGGGEWAHYRVVGPGPGDPVLLRGSVILSGHSGWDEHWGGDYTLRREGDRLILRREALHWAATKEPGPLGRREEDHDEVYYVTEIETAVEIVYRYRPTGLTAQSFTLFYKVHEGDTLAAVAEHLELQTSWARNAQPWPAVGDWLRFALPLPVGQRRYPAVRAGE